MLQPEIVFDNRYELIRMLGRGGFAEVWLVRDNLTGLEEALKIYAPGSGMDEDGLKIFAQELAVVHDLHHPHLLTPKVLGQFEQQPYLVLQYCPNGSLNKRVGQCTEEEAWKILEQVASGLAYLHKRNIVHQDIKPDNILVDANGDYMVSDFGISLKAQSTLRKSFRVQANSGTQAYMAPERFSEEPNPTPASDIWSLGATMFELMEGVVPFAGDMGGLAQKKGADIPRIHADVSEELKRSIYAMLTLNMSERPTAVQLVEMANKKKSGNVYSSNQTKKIEYETSSIQKPVSQPKPKNWIWFFIAAIVAAGIVAVFLMPKRSTTNAEQSAPDENIEGSQPEEVFPDSGKVVDMLQRYAEYCAKNDSAGIETIFTPQVLRYHNICNVSRQEVIRRHLNYDSKYGVYGKHSSYRWQTLTINQVSDTHAEVTCINDYHIDRVDPKKQTDFVLEQHFVINEEYQIVSIYNNDLSKR